MDTSDYSYKIKKRLSVDDLIELQSTHWPKLVELNNRYAPQIDITNGIPRQPEFLDLLRGSWLLDKRSNRPPYKNVTSGVGFGFGLLLNHIFGMEWCLIKDDYGEDISMIYFSDRPGYKELSFPPFSYVSKRENVQNVEVFVDAVAHITKLLANSSSE